MRDIFITLAILVCIVAGVLVGWMGLFPQGLFTYLDSMTWWILDGLLLLVGIDLGLNKIWKKLKGDGWRMAVLPVAVIIGTFLGAMVACAILSFPLIQGLSITAGFGWYTLDSLLLGQLKGPEWAALGFLANVFREMIAFLIIPIFHKWNKTVCGIASGGATTMDTTLVLIDRVGGAEYAALAFIQGLVCSLLVPIIIPFLCKL